MITCLMEINTAVILAGGRGTRFKELTDLIPKPMIEVAGKPILIHIINHYVSFGVQEIYILTGYKHEYVVNYFNKNYKKNNDGNFQFNDSVKIIIQDTGIKTMTGGRIGQFLDKVDVEDFFLTYGDGLSNVDLNKLEKQFIKNKTLAMVTAVRPPARFGSLDINGNMVSRFGEKKQVNSGWINGGFFVLNRKIREFIRDNSEVFEDYPLEQLAKKGSLTAYKHNGFWQCIDTIREREIIESAIKNKEFILYE